MNKFKNFLMFLLLVAVLVLGGFYLKLYNDLAELEIEHSNLTAELNSLRGSSEELLAQKEMDDKRYAELEAKLKNVEVGTISAPDPGAETSVFSETGESSESDPRTEETASQGTVAPATMKELWNSTEQIVNTMNASNGDWSVYVRNFAANSEFSVSSHQMQAASLIKLYIMGAVYEYYDSLLAANDASVLDSNLYSMITVSDNTAANNLVTFLGNGDPAAGMNVVNTFCSSHGFYDTHMGRLLLAPNDVDDNYTSVEDCGRFLTMIYYNDGMLTYPEKMYDLLKQQQVLTKLPQGVPSEGGARVANKTGELSNVENDVAIIYNAPKSDYIICVMSQNLNDTYSARNQIINLSNIAYGYFNS